MAYSCNPELGRLRRVDCYEFEASPIYILSSRPVVQLENSPKQNNKTKVNKNVNKGKR